MSSEFGATALLEDETSMGNPTPHDSRRRGFRTVGRACLPVSIPQLCHLGYDLRVLVFSFSRFLHLLPMCIFSVLFIFSSSLSIFLTF